MIESRARILACAVLLGISACGGGDPRVYASLDSMKGVDDYSIVKSIKVPNDAMDIRVSYDVETDRYHVSYSTLSMQFATVELSPLRGQLRNSAISAVGFGVVVPDEAELYFGCRDSLVGPAADGSVPKDAFFVANAGGRQQQWNLIHRSELARRLCGDS